MTLGGAGVSLTGTVNFVPRHMPADGKLRLTQIQQDWDQGIGSFFTTTGNVAIHAEFFAQASIAIGKKPFAFTRGIHQKLAGFDQILFDFGSIGVENQDQQIPQTAHWTGAGSDWNDPHNWDTGMQLVWLEGGITGSGAVLAANGGAQLSSDNEKWLVGVTFQNAGTTTWSGAGTLLFIDGATWNNPANSVLDAQGDAAMFFLAGQSTGFTNAGLFKKSAGPDVTYVSTALSNSGTMQALSGTLAFGSGGTSTGILSIASGGTLDLNDGTYTLASVSGTGTFSVSGATATVSGALAAGTINVTNGGLTVSGAVTATALAVTEFDVATATATFNGTVTVATFTARSGALGGQVTVVFQAATTIQTSFAADYGSTVTVNGLLVGTIPTFTVLDGFVVLNNAASATTGQFSVSNGSVAVNRPLTNQGAFTVSGGSVTISGPLTNQGSFTVSGGSVTAANTLTTQSLVADGGITTLNGAVTSQSVSVVGGVIAVDPMIHQIVTTPGASVVVGGSLTTPSLGVLGATASGLLLTDARITPDILHAAAGVFTVNGTATVQSFNLVGVLAGTGTLTVTGSGTWTRGWMEGAGTTSIGALVTLTLQDSLTTEPRDKYLVQRTLRNAGTVNWLAGNILGSGGVFQNLALATFQDNSTSRTATIATVNNAGLIQLRVTTFTSDTLTITGALAIGAGAKMVLANLTNYANNTLTGGTYQVTGALQVTTGAADIRTNAATIMLNGLQAKFVDNLNQDAVRNLATNTAAGQLTFTNGHNFTPAGDFANAGMFTLGTTSSLSLGSVTWNNTGLFQWTGTGGICFYGNGAFVNQMGATFDAQGDGTMYNAGHVSNAGTFTKSAGSGTTQIKATFDNSGTVSVRSGTLYLSGSFTNFANKALAGGSYLVSGSGILKFTGADIRTNAATIVLDGTTAAITDQSNNNALANFANNTAAGSFTVRNGFTFTTSGDFNNDGTATVGSGSTFSVTGTYGQSGTANVQATGTLTLQGPFSNFDPSSGTLTGGTYQIAGLFQFSDAATAPIATNAANLTFDGPAAQVTDLAGNDALGSSLLANAAGAGLTLVDGASLSLPTDFSNAGTLVVGAGLTTLQGGTLQADGLVDLEGGLLNGAGTLQGTVLNNAEIDVGQPSSPGVLMVTGDYSGGGTLVVEIGGTNPGTDFDQLMIGGQATFAGGTLTINLINGFVPDPTNPDSFQVLTFGAHDPADDFAVYNGLDLGNGVSLTPSYDSGSLTLVATSSGGAPSIPGQSPRDYRSVATGTATSAEAHLAREPAGRDRFFAGEGDAYRVLNVGSARGRLAIQNLPDLGLGFDPNPTLDDTVLTRTMRAR